MEPVSNRLLLGGDMRGSLATLGYILAGWGADAALPLAAEEKWWAALRDSFGGPEDEPNLEVWRSWAAGVEPQVTLPELPQRPQLLISRLRSDLSLAFHRTGLGTSLGRDFVMRLGEDAFTPDLIFVRSRSASPLYESHLDGPADIVVEICGPWNSDYVAGLKKERYAGRASASTGSSTQRSAALSCSGSARTDTRVWGLMWKVATALLWNRGSGSTRRSSGLRRRAGGNRSSRFQSLIQATD